MCWRKTETRYKYDTHGLPQTAVFALKPSITCRRHHPQNVSVDRRHLKKSTPSAERSCRLSILSSESETCSPETRRDTVLVGGAPSPHICGGTTIEQKQDPASPALEQTVPRLLLLDLGVFRQLSEQAVLLVLLGFLGTRTRGARASKATTEEGTEENTTHANYIRTYRYRRSDSVGLVSGSPANRITSVHGPLYLWSRALVPVHAKKRCTPDLQHVTQSALYLSASLSSSCVHTRKTNPAGCCDHKRPRKN